jgi:hypothetical protein
MCGKTLKRAALLLGTVAIGPKCAARMFTKTGRARMTVLIRKQSPQTSPDQMSLEFA